MQAIVAVTTVGSEQQANTLAEELVGRRQAACVNIIPVQRSVYRWEGKIRDDSEFLLVIKSTAEEYEAIEGTIQELHEYDVPEILAFNVGRGERKFLEWLDASTGPAVGSSSVDESSEQL